MIRLALLTALALLSTASLAQAQTTPVIHNHAAADLIDGSVHPEQIPDVIAYRLALLSLTTPANPTYYQTSRQQAQFSEVGLSEPEKSALTPILAKFNSDYHSLIQSYNATATALNAKGERADISSFLVQRDQLVQAVHDQIKGTFATDRWAHFDAWVQQQKTRMKVARQEASR